MFLEDIILQQIQPCTAGKNRIKILAALSTNISPLMPYINGTIASAVYNQKMNWLTYRMGEKIVTLFGEKVAVTKLLNETDAYETLDAIKETINKIESQKDTIIPNTEMKKIPTPLDIYKMLPKMNCRKCGEATCLAFAGKLLTAQTDLEKCLALYEPAYESKRQKLEDIFEQFGLRGN